MYHGRADERIQAACEAEGLGSQVKGFGQVLNFPNGMGEKMYKIPIVSSNTIIQVN